MLSANKRSMPNKALQPTAKPLRAFAAAELRRWAYKQEVTHMPRQKQISPFFLVLVDDRKKLFTVLGPMTDDTPWNTRVCQAQDRGEHLRCFTAGAGQSRDQIIENIRQDLRLEYTDERLV